MENDRVVDSELGEVVNTNDDLDFFLVNGTSIVPPQKGHFSFKVYCSNG